MRTEAVTLSAVGESIGVKYDGPDRPVSDVHHDSRLVSPGALFVAIKGERSDGHDHVADAVARGAAAVIVERAVGGEVPELIVPDSRAALALAAAAVHGDPSARLTIVGVTGTNGKTTVTHMIESIAQTGGAATGLIGTLGARIGDTPVAIDRTTPEASDTQRLLARMVDAGADVVAMEVSSHAMALHRADAIRFAVVAFTNLSQDHLDFHGDMESYFAEKARLFSPSRAETAVIWVDDPWGRRLAGMADLAVVTVGIEEPSEVAAAEVVSAAWGSTFVLSAGGESERVTVPVPARFNVANALVAVAVCLNTGMSFGDVCAGLEQLSQVPGRFELVQGEWAFHAIVDYAHTPDAVATAIAEARSLTTGRVLVVAGAGGDRDQDKRPLMGRAASGADLTIITSDNPRTEAPEAIVADVVRGVTDEADLVVEVDRRGAIRSAISAAHQGDIVLVLGKGHEQGQDFGGGRVEPFDDRVVVVEEAAVLAGGTEH